MKLKNTLLLFSTFLVTTILAHGNHQHSDSNLIHSFHNILTYGAPILIVISGIAIYKVRKKSK